MKRTKNSDDQSGAGQSESQPLERYDLRILRSMRKIIRAVDIYSRKLKGNHDITGPQLVCLLEIAEHGPITSSAISKNVHLSASTVVGILDRLEAKELINRERDTKDRRLVHVTVTDKGRELADAAPSPLQDSLAEALRDLPELEQAAIALSLEKIVDLMEARHIDAAPILETGPVQQSNGDNNTLNCE